VIAALVTGVTCNDPTGGHPEDNFLKRSSSESLQVLRVGWPLTSPEVHGTQVPQMDFNDYGGFFYQSEVIVIVAVVTRATCNDSTGGHPKENFLKRSSFGKLTRSEGGGWALTTSSALGTQVAQLCHDYYWMFFY